MAWFCLALLLFHTFVFIFVSTFVFVFVCVLSPFPCNCPDYDLVLTSSVDFFLLFNLATKMIAVHWDQTGGLLSSHFARFAHFADNCHQTWCHHGASVITIRDVINCLTPFHYWDTDTTACFNLQASSSSRSRIHAQVCSWIYTFQWDLLLKILPLICLHGIRLHKFNTGWCALMTFKSLYISFDVKIKTDFSNIPNENGKVRV